MTADAIPDELMLAALDRACRHNERTAVRFATAVEHMGLTPGAASTRRLRPQRESLQAAGLIEQSKAYGREVWGLTTKGRRRLSRGTPPELPESPQHREWREARALAEQEIERLRSQLRDCITDAMERLDSESPSDVLFAVGERLQRECWRVASATYCLDEWAEPDDATADTDDGPAGRRSTRLWRVGS